MHATPIEPLEIVEWDSRSEKTTPLLTQIAPWEALERLDAPSKHYAIPQGTIEAQPPPMEEVAAQEEEEPEVTHAVFFGENIRRVLKVLRR